MSSASIDRVFLEAIKYVSQQLVATIEEVIQVQEDGKTETPDRRGRNW